MKLQGDGQLQTSKTRQRMQLSDGRTFAFDEYGAADGFPVVYMHGTPGSRLEWLMFGTDEMVRTANIRIIVPDRPGIGLSQFKPDRTLVSALEWPVLMKTTKGSRR